MDNWMLDHLEDECPTCHGSGSQWVQGSFETCAKCGGSGMVPSNTGHKLLDFLKRHGQSLWTPD